MYRILAQLWNQRCASCGCNHKGLNVEHSTGILIPKDKTFLDKLHDAEQIGIQLQNSDQPGVAFVSIFSSNGGYKDPEDEDVLAFYADREGLTKLRDSLNAALSVMDN